jgi:hypothetical protein
MKAANPSAAGHPLRCDRDERRGWHYGGLAFGEVLCYSTS